MVKVKRAEMAAEATRINLEQLARLGGELRSSRRLGGMTQAEVGARAGIARSTVSDVELGRGGGHTLDTWQRLGLAVGRPLRTEFARDHRAEPADAGHLAMQELVLRLGRAAGYVGTFELPTRPADPSRSADVGLRDDRRRLLILVECWNTFGDIGAAARSTNRKLAEADRIAVAFGRERPHRVAGCWVVKATVRNRRLVARYPELFASRFPGPSAGWVRGLSGRMEPPNDPGLVWCDVSASRIFAWRRATPS